MFERKTATLVMKEEISKEGKLPPNQADMRSEKKSLKEAEKIPNSDSLLIYSTRKADLPVKSSESNKIENSDEMIPEAGQTMRIMISSGLELEEDTSNLSVESTCSVKSYNISNNKR